jgi:tetraacyldisaccharide 4'-kinase
MRAPEFWWRPPGIVARLLRPPAALYGAMAVRRMGQQGMRSALPVLCVGNFVVGGSGKTPFAIAIAERLVELGERPAFLTRGYGGALPGPIVVDPPTHTSSDVGDEGLLLARHAMTVVARSRPDGAKLIERSAASVIVMDDGLQNPSLCKDLAFTVVDAEIGVGNGLCLPAGPLRAPLSDQWRFAQALVLMGSSTGVTKLLGKEARRRDLSVIAANLVPDHLVAAQFAGRRVVAFAGIGRPDKFFATLRSIGAVVVAQHGFPDHHRFNAGELSALGAQAVQAQAMLVTTEKDLTRIGAQLAGILPGAGLCALPVRARIENGHELEIVLERALASRRQRPQT